MEGMIILTIHILGKSQPSQISNSKSYGPFAIKREETAKKFFFELMLFLNIFQYKNHIWHINKKNFFLAVSLLSIAKGTFVLCLIIKNSFITFVFNFIFAY